MAWEGHCPTYMLHIDASIRLTPSYRRKRATPAHTRQVGRLHIVRVQCNTVGHQHGDASTAVFTASSNFWFLRERLPYNHVH